MIDAIHDGTFSPDGERSTFFRASADVPERSNDVQVKREGLDDDGFILVSDSECNEHTGVPGTAVDEIAEPPSADLGGDSSDSDSSSSDAGSSDCSDVALMQPHVKRFRARIPLDESWYVHAKSNLVHRFNGDVHNDVNSWCVASA
jgi:hypothetical protein